MRWITAAVLGCLLMTGTAAAQRVQPTIINGTPTEITSVPWQVYVYNESRGAGCGGSVLSARVVLTAAHCVANGATALPPSAFTVVAGLSDLKTWTFGQTPPSGAQAVGVASLRMHPAYVPEPYIADDVAVLTLSKALDLSTPRTKAIALAPSGGAPAPGAAVLVSGYGVQQPAGQPNGKLYSTTLSVMSDIDCLTTITPNMSAGVLCAVSATSATCFGDSGGPLVAGGVLVGVVSATNGDAPCGAGRPAVFADVTVPEIRAFIDGSDTPPIAPRLSGNAGLSTLNPPIAGSPMTCVPGAWADAASIAYTFLDNATGALLGSGAGAVFTPLPAQVGVSFACVTHASNAGGTSSARSGPTAALLPDTVAPQAVLRAVRCRKRRCIVRFQAADSNSLGALAIRVTATKRVRGWCRKGKGRKRHRVRCTKRRTKQFAVRHVAGVDWRATARRVPRGRVTVRLQVKDAVGNSAGGRHLKKRVRVR
jgi:hypothetical protein